MGDKEADETRVCGQCHKEVAESNFALHESHCQRFLCLCPDCEEPVPRDLLDQHREDQHSLVKCTKCNKKLERCQLQDHESAECEERMQCCDFCQLELPFSNMAPHTMACGSRTEHCSDCGDYVTLKDQLDHARTCSASSSDSVPTPPTHRQTWRPSVPAEEIEEHQELHDPTSSEESDGETDNSRQLDLGSGMTGLTSSLKSGSFSGRRGRHGGWAEVEEVGDQISTCPYCHLALPLVTLRWHQAKCQIHVNLK